MLSSSVSWEEVCRRVGQVLRRSLEGQHRIEAVDCDSGVVYDPPRVFTKFGVCKPLVKCGSDAGQSVFVGLPSQKDVAEWAECLRAGGFEHPASFEG